MEGPINQGNEFEEHQLGSEGESAECCTTLDVEPGVTNGDRRMEISAVSELAEPYVGMEFDSEEDARAFYYDYARHKGFLARISSFYCSKLNGEKISREFVCSKQGFYKNTDVPNGTKKRRKRPSTRTGCTAMMTVRKQDPSGKWFVVKFHKDHNHPLLSPNEMWRVRPRRRTFDVKKRFADHLPEKRIRKLLASSNADCSGQSSMASNDNMKKRQRNFPGDCETLLEYLKRKQAENPAFFFAIDVDEKQSLTKVFWVDGRSRMAYDYFGDVVTIDTTYKTKRSRMPFATFTGVNHHKQSVLFGCALLSDETTSTFVWLFKTWLTSMNGRYPISIVTDHDKAIRAAVALVFPETNHRFCLWHIIRKQNEMLPHVVFAHPHFQEEFLNFVQQAETIEEFESSWEKLLEKYMLKENEWLKSLYGDRQQWVPVYLRDKFFADLSTNQQSDNMNSFFDGYVDAQTTPQDFVTQYEKGLNSRYEKEDEDYLTLDTLPVLCTRSTVEKQAASIYTKRVFETFQEEILEECNYSVDKIDDDGATNVYKVARFDQERKAQTVTFNIAEMRAHCSCKKFEFSGILCRHVLAVFRVTNIFTIPSHYILKRWTKNANNEVVLDQYGIEVQANYNERTMLRYNILCREALKFIEDAAQSADVFNVAMGSIRDTAKKVNAAKEIVARAEKMGIDGTMYEDSFNVEVEANALAIQETLQDPEYFRIKRQASTSRLRSASEKSSFKSPACSLCKGPKHNIRSCPRASNVSTEQINQGHASIFVQDGTQNTILQ